MTTVLAVFTSEGCIGRCDAKCHEATSPACDCICSGRNHGVGSPRAVENTSALVAERAEATTQLDMLRDFAARHGLETAALEVHAELPLFA